MIADIGTAGAGFNKWRGPVLINNAIDCNSYCNRLQRGIALITPFPQVIRPEICGLVHYPAITGDAVKKMV